jgi:hypothetical protein
MYLKLLNDLEKMNKDVRNMKLYLIERSLFVVHNEQLRIPADLDWKTKQEANGSETNGQKAAEREENQKSMNDEDLLIVTDCITELI